MSERTVIYRMPDGSCSLGDAFFQDGRPVAPHGHAYNPRPAEDIMGFGDLDGPASVWEHVDGSHQLLVPEEGP